MKREVVPVAVLKNYFSPYRPWAVGLFPDDVVQHSSMSGRAPEKSAFT
jgi:hypothetical protein